MIFDIKEGETGLLASWKGTLEMKRLANLDFRHAYLNQIATLTNFTCHYKKSNNRPFYLNIHYQH